MAQNNDLLKGAAIGLGVAVLVPVVVAALMPVIRPMARSALKATIYAYEKGRETLEGIGETVDDIVAEVEEELVDAHDATGLTDDAKTQSPDADPAAHG
ncbi:MAG: DUF5132 domain-containing protein [Gammaproteobacteria bacterium]|jgi:hypothetical protein